MSERDDRQLLEAMAAGDADAVRRLIASAGPVVYGYLYARVGGDPTAAEDLLQETFLEAIKSAASFRGDSELSTWICAIARRRLARWYEGERRRAVVERGLVVVEGGGDDSGDLEVDDRDELIRAMGRLPALHRQVLVLKYLDGRSVAEIAIEIGRSRVQVQSLLQRSRDGLRREIEAQGA